MAKRISELRTAGKAGNTSREYLLLSNIDTNSSTKIALNDVFPTLQSGKATGLTNTAAATSSPLDLFVSGGVGTSTSNVDKSILIFKGLKVRDSTNALTIYNETSQTDDKKQNLVLQLTQSNIDLSLTDNTSSIFLSEVGGSNVLNLQTSNINGTLPVSRGGSGLATIAAGDILIGNGTSALQTVGAMVKGSVLVGAGVGFAPTELGVGTNGLVLTADSTTVSGLKWDKPTINTVSLTNHLVTNNYDVVMGSGYLTAVNASSSGISLSTSTNDVYIGGGARYFDSKLTVDGSITVGNSSGTNSQLIKMSDCVTGASPNFTIQGASNQDNNTGGTLNLKGGTGQSSGNGGNVVISSGSGGAGGTAGNVQLQSGGSVGLEVDSNRDINVTENVTLNQGKTLEWRGTETVTQATSITTAVTLNASAGVIVLHATAIGGHDSHYFTFNNTLINSRSIILLTCEVDGAEASGAGLTAQIASRAAGTVQIRVSNTGNATTTTNHSIHFLIMNVYV